MQRPLAQENWLGGQVRAEDGNGGECSRSRAPFFILLSFRILCVVGSLPKGFKAVSLGDLQNHLCGLTVAASPPLPRGLRDPPRRRSTLPPLSRPSRALSPAGPVLPANLVLRERGRHPVLLGLPPLYPDALSSFLPPGAPLSAHAGSPRPAPLTEGCPVWSPEQVALDSSSLFPQSLSPSQSQRLGMHRLFSHLKRSEGQVC